SIQSSVSEVVDNAGFEASTTTPVPGWNASSASLSYATGSNAYAGSQSLIITTTPQYGAGESQRKYACQPGEVYLVSGAITNLVNNGPAIVQLTFYNASGSVVGSGGPSSTVSGWGMYSGKVTVPAGAVYFTIRLQNNGVAGSSAWWDSIKLSRIRSLDSEVADGSTYARIYGSELSSGKHRIGVAGSGYRVGDQRNLLQRTITNYPSKVSPGVSYSASAGTPATATISVAAFTALLGSVSVSYNAASASVTGTNGTNVNYYLYFNDPTYSGGTHTLVATTNQNDLYSGDGYVYVGYVTVAFPSSGSGSGGGTGCPL